MQLRTKVGVFLLSKFFSICFSIYDWLETKRRAWNHYRLAGSCLMVYAIFDVIQFFRYRRLTISEELYEERRRKNLPDLPKYKLFGENPEYDKYDTDFIFEKRGAIEDLTLSSGKVD